MAFSNKEVETRVVEMEFDNKQFEKGAEQTLSTLDKLKKSLNFKNADSGLDTLQKSINRVSFKGLTDQVGSIESAFTTLAGRIKINFFDQIANYTLNAAKQLERTTIGQIISGGKSRAMNIATAKFKMEGMGVTWDEISRDLEYAVGGTAYGLDAAANIGSQLVASGVQVGTDMATALRAVSGVAAMTSSSYEEIGNVFAAVAGQGKVMAMQLNQLSLRGINAAATLAKYMGVTEAEVRDLVSKGQVDFNTFAMAMDSAFGEHAKEANKTFTGAMSNVRAALSKIGQMFYSPFYDAMIAPLNTIRETINDVKAALTDTKDGTVVSFEERLAEVVKLGGETLDLLIKIARIGIKEVVQNVDKLNAKMDGIINTMKSVKKWMEQAIPDNASTKLEAVADAIDTITEAEQKAAWDIWNKGLYGNGEERIKNLEAEGLNASRVQKYIDALIAANFDEKKAQEALGMAIANTSSEVEAQVDAYDGLSNGARVIINLMQTFGTVFKEAVKIVGTAKGAFHDIFPSASEHKILVIITEELLNFVKKLRLTENDTKNLRKTFGGLLSIIRFFYDIFSSVIRAFEGASAALTGGDSLILKVTGSIGELITKFVKLVESTSFFPKLIENMQHKTEKLLDRLVKLIGIEPDKWVDKLYSKAEKMAKFIDSHSFPEMIDALKGKIESLISSLKTKISVKEGVFGGIAKALEVTKNYLGSALKWLKDFIVSAADFMKNLRYIFSGQWDSLVTKGKNSIASHFQNMASSIDSIVETFANTINNLLNKLNTIDETQVEAATKKYSAASSSVGNLLSNVKADVHTNKDNVEGILDGVKDIVVIFSTFISAISFYKLSDGIQSFGQGFESLTISIETVSVKMAKAIRRLSMSMSFKYIADGMKSLAIAILLVVLSIAGLTYVANKDNADAVWKASGIIAALLAEIGVLTITIANFSSIPGVATIFGAAVMFFGLAAAIGVLLIAIKEVTTSYELQRRLSIIVDTIWSVAKWFIILGGALAVVYNVTNAITAKKTGITAPINDLSKILISLAGSLLIMSLVVAVFGSMSSDKLDQGLKGLVGVMLTIALSIWAMILAFRGNKYGSSITDKSVEALANLTKSLAKSIFVMSASFGLLTAVIGLIGRSEGGKKAIAAALGILVGMLASLAATVTAIVGLTKKFGVSEKQIAALNDLMKTILIFMSVMTVSFLLVTAAMALVDVDTRAQSLSAFVVMASSVILMAASITVIANELQGTKIAEYEMMIKIIKALTLCVLGISAAFALLAIVSLVNPLGVVGAIISIIGSFALIAQIFMRAVKSNNYLMVPSNHFKTIADSFLLMALAMVAISAALSLLIFSIANNDVSFGDAVAIIGAWAFGMGSIMFALYEVAKQVDGPAIDKITDVGKAFFMIALGLSASALAMSILFDAVANLDQDAGDIIAGFAALTGILVGATAIAAKLEDANNVLYSGIAMAAVLASFALSMAALATAIWAIGKFNIDLGIIDKFTKMFSAILGLVDIALAISTAKSFSLINAVGIVAVMVSALAGMTALIFVLTAVDWAKLRDALGNIDLIVEIISVLGEVIALPLLILFTAVNEAKGTGDKYIKIAASFTLMMLGLAAMAGAIGILFLAISNSKLTVETISEVIGSFLLGLAMVLGTLIAMSKGIKGGNLTNMLTLAGSFALIAAGIAAVALALSVMFYTIKDIDIINVATVTTLFTVLIFVMSYVVILATQIEDSAKAITSALSVALGLLAFSAVLIALGGALWVIGKMNISTKVINNISDFMTAILGLFLAMEALSTLETFSVLNVLAASGGFVIALLGFVGFLHALAAVDYEALSNVLQVLADHELFTTLSIVIPLLLTLVGIVVGPEIAAGMAAFAAGILGIAAALLALSLAVYILAEAYKTFVEAQNMSALSDISKVSDKTIAYAARGKTSGEYFAEGLRRGLVDSSGNLTDAGRNAMRAVVNGVNEEGEIHSPSKVGERQGEFYAEGITNGVLGSQNELYNASQILGNSMINGFADSMVAADTSKYVRTLSDDFATTYGDSLQAGFESAQDSVQEGFGDFTFDYSEAFDDAPISPTITPVIDAEELDNQVQAVRQDEALGLTPVIDFGDLSNISLDTSTLATDLSNGLDIEGELKKSLGLDENSEGGLLGGLDEIFNGEDGLEKKIFGEEGIDGLKTEFNNALNGDSGLVNSLLGDSNNGLGGLFSGLSGDITGGLDGLGSSIISELGEGSFIGKILLSIADKVGAKVDIYNIGHSTEDEAYSELQMGMPGDRFARFRNRNGQMVALDRDTSEYWYWSDDMWHSGTGQQGGSLYVY